MAKRLTDTTKWDREDFRELSPKMKLAWLYLVDHCDHLGLWHEDYGLMSFRVGFKITREEVQECFGHRLVRVSNSRLFLPNFVKFQYGTLDTASPMHRRVINGLSELGLSIDGTDQPQSRHSTDTLPEGYKKKEKNKEKKKEKNTKGGVGGFDFEALYKLYPRKIGRTEGSKIFLRTVKTQLDYDALRAAIAHYCHFLHRENTEPKYIKHFDSFMNQWRDWVNPQPDIVPQPKPFDHDALWQTDPVDEVADA